MAMGRAFAQEKGLGAEEEYFAKGAVVAQDPLAFETLDMLDDEDKRRLRREVTHKVSWLESRRWRSFGALTAR